MEHFLFVPAALLTLLCACNATQSQPDFYTVEGELEDTLSNGKMIYISRYDDYKILDSTWVEGNKSVFTGKVDTVSMCRIDVTDEAFGNC